MDWLRFSNPTDHYPFKRKAKIGPGPMNQTLRKAEECIAWGEGGSTPRDVGGVLELCARCPEDGG